MRIVGEIGLLILQVLQIREGSSLPFDVVSPTSSLLALGISGSTREYAAQIAALLHRGSSLILLLLSSVSNYRGQFFLFVLRQ